MLVQILLLDIVFSLDSVITAVGMANDLGIMVTAMVIAMLVMLVSAGAVERLRRTATRASRSWPWPSCS